MHITYFFILQFFLHQRIIASLSCLGFLYAIYLVKKLLNYLYWSIIILKTIAQVILPSHRIHIISLHQKIWKSEKNLQNLEHEKKWSSWTLTNSTSPHLVRAWVWPTLLRATTLYIPTSTFEAGSNLRIERPSASSRILTRWLSVMTRSFLRGIKQ